jgi:hypothetical protein
MIMSKHIFNSGCFQSVATIAGVAVLLGMVHVAPLHAQDSAGASSDANTMIEESSYGSYQPKERATLKIAYSIGFPHGGLHDYTGEVSPRGFDLTLAWPVFKSLFVGAGFGFNSFYQEKDRTTYEVDNTAITGKLYRYVDYWSFSAVAQYVFLKPKSVVRPYVGVRVGVAALSMTTLVVDLAYQDAPAGFLVVPEAGVNFNLSKQLALYASYQLNYSTASVQGATQDFSSLSFSSIQIGVTLGMGAI